MRSGLVVLAGTVLNEFLGVCKAAIAHPAFTAANISTRELRDQLESMSEAAARARLAGPVGGGGGICALLGQVRAAGQRALAPVQGLDRPTRDDHAESLGGGSQLGRDFAASRDVATTLEAPSRALEAALAAPWDADGGGPAAVTPAVIGCIAAVEAAVVSLEAHKPSMECARVTDFWENAKLQVPHPHPRPLPHPLSTPLPLPPSPPPAPSP